MKKIMYPMALIGLLLANRSFINAMPASTPESESAEVSRLQGELDEMMRNPGRYMSKDMYDMLKIAKENTDPVVLADVISDSRNVLRIKGLHDRLNALIADPTIDYETRGMLWDTQVSEDEEVLTNMVWLGDEQLDQFASIKDLREPVESCLREVEHTLNATSLIGFLVVIRFAYQNMPETPKEAVLASKKLGDWQTRYKELRDVYLRLRSVPKYYEVGPNLSRVLKKEESDLGLAEPATLRPTQLIDIQLQMEILNVPGLETAFLDYVYLKLKTELNLFIERCEEERQETLLVEAQQIREALEKKVNDLKAEKAARTRR